MSLFSNDPFAEPMNGTQKLSFVLYVFLSIVSIWATAESLHASLKLPLVVSYLSATFIIFSLGLLMKLIKTNVDNVTYGPALLMIPVFLLLWGVSLLTNSHKIFTQFNQSDICREQVQTNINTLSILPSKAKGIALQGLTEYQIEVKKRITVLTTEICAKADPGYGKEAQKAHMRLNEIFTTTLDIEQKVNRYPAGYKGACKAASESVEPILQEQLRSKIASDRARIREDAKKCLESTDTTVIPKLKALADATDEVLINKAPDVLGQARASYKSLCDCYESTLDINLEYNMTSPCSLNTIASVLSFVKKNTDYRPSYLLSLLIALVIDLAAFSILFFGVLKKYE